jgi:hypothetical protein
MEKIPMNESRLFPRLGVITSVRDDELQAAVSVAHAAAATLEAAAQALRADRGSADLPWQLEKDARAVRAMAYDAALDRLVLARVLREHPEYIERASLIAHTYGRVYGERA